MIQGRHTQLFIPPSGIEIVAPIEDVDASTITKTDTDEDGIATLPPATQQECAKLVAQVREGMSAKQFSVLKNELRHRADLTTGQRAIVLTALDARLRGARRSPLQPSQRRKGVTSASAARRASPMDPYARRAVVLGPKEFCILFDADGNPRIVKGPARVFPGPHDTFLQRGSRRRVYDAYELAEHQALWLRIIAPIPKERLALHLPPGAALDRDVYPPGHEMIVRGQPTVFFPFIEAEVIHPETREPHVGNDHSAVVINAIGIDQKSGIYVRDLRTGMVKMVRGETSYLVDPRYEEHVHRRVPREQWNLWIGHAEPHKVTRDEAVATPWAISVTIPNNEAVLITSRHGRRVEVGPKVVLLDYEEAITALKLSKGPSKDGKATVTTCFLRVRGGRVSDSFELDSADFVRFKVRLGFAGHFEGEGDAWFQVEDPVKLLADTVRARLREVARAHGAAKLLTDFASVTREALLKDGVMRFAENGMVIDRVDVLSASIGDSALADLFLGVQRESVKLQLHDAAGHAPARERAPPGHHRRRAAAIPPARRSSARPRPTRSRPRCATRSRCAPSSSRPSTRPPSSSARSATRSACWSSKCARSASSPRRRRRRSSRRPRPRRARASSDTRSTSRTSRPSPRSSRARPGHRRGRRREARRPSSPSSSGRSTPRPTAR